MLNGMARGPPGARKARLYGTVEAPCPPYLKVVEPGLLMYT